MVTVIENRDAALEKANQVRIGMAAVKHDVAALPHQDGRLLVAQLLEQPVGFVPSMRVGALLRSIWKVGRYRTGAWLSSADVRSGDRRVDELTERQRLALGAALRRGL